MSPKKAASQKKAPSAEERTAETQDSSRDKTVAALITEQAREALSVIFAVRFANSLCVRTFFQPDEYFQVLEPAWQMMYGNDSGAWLTWEWRHALRSSIHPMIFTLGYFLVDSFWATYNVPTVKAKWLLMAPKVLQTGFAALSDWYTWRLAEKLYGPSSAAAWSVLLMALLNPWQWYTATRTFSNCLETTLTAMALYYWPWEILGIEAKKRESRDSPDLFNTPSQVNSLRLSLLLAAFAVLLRPTNIFVWIAICTLAFTRFTLSGNSPLDRRVLVILFREVILCGSIALGISLVCDRQYFEEWKFPPFAWLHFNVTKDLAKFYGQNDWHYYLSQGIPLLCTTITPFAFQGLVRSLDSESSYPVTTSNTLKALTFIVITTISTLSLVSHKEIRFIQPLLPALHILAAPYITSFFTTLSASGATTCPPPALGWKRKPLLAAALLVNIVVGGYLSWFHAAAPIQVMTFLRGEFERIHPDHLSFGRAARNATASPDIEPPQELFALFLTPCHATPWRSHLIYPALSARALTCEPPLDTAPDSPERAAYQDETRQFYIDPVTFLAKYIWPRDGPGEHMARYIVGFEGIETPLRMYFDSAGPGSRHRIQPREVWSGWNGLFTDDERKSGRLVVWDTGFYDD
ncbi:Alg9-like mannosyltransferase family-domain-containing protein [Hypoxylon argillaceum]|nr:Alg9-like mannosyltransferase family-domain-containing protein [Hypoxylon argillaceum]KAI1149202.1 Alg9-like mannosyltransferase family-domain-containing protein [Nemania diffusa]